MGVMNSIRRALFGINYQRDIPPGPSEDLEHAARTLNQQLSTYLEKPDPLAALLNDLWNKREMRKHHERLRRDAG